MNGRMTEDNRQVKSLNMSDVEMIFGKPDSGKDETVHMVVNERRQNTLHPVNNASHKVGSNSANQPLLEPDRGKQLPPLAGPEVDHLDDEKPVTNKKPYPGIDDGLLEPEDKKPTSPHDDEGMVSWENMFILMRDYVDFGYVGRDATPFKEKVLDGDVDKEVAIPTHDEGTEDGNPWDSGVDEADFAYDGTRFDIDDRVGSPIPGMIIPDVNTYQQKKNLAQGMMDLALFTANTNQLRYVIETSSSHPYYYFSLVSISFSLILQIAVGIGLIMNSRYNVKDEKDICKADKINNMTVLGIFLITIVNVFIAAFSVAPTPISPRALSAPMRLAPNASVI